MHQKGVDYDNSIVFNGQKETAIHADRTSDRHCHHRYLITLEFHGLLAYCCLLFRNIFLLLTKSRMRIFEFIGSNIWMKMLFVLTALYGLRRIHFDMTQL